MSPPFSACTRARAANAGLRGGKVNRCSAALTISIVDIIILAEHLLVSLHFMETWLPCLISHHHYACVELECAGIHNKRRALLLQVGFSITSSDTSFEACFWSGPT